MSSFPIFVDVGGLVPPLVVGGGDLAAAKVRTLLLKAPRVALSSAQAPASLAPLIADGVVAIIPASPSECDVRGRPLVVAATSDDAEDARISALARSLGVPVNVPDRPELDWDALARPGQAFAIYMGVRKAGRIAARLLAAGADPTTPIVIVENGACDGRRTIACSLFDLPVAISTKRITGPAILFAGLDWADSGIEPPADVDRFAEMSLAPRAPCRPSPMVSSRFAPEVHR